jgi:RNA polymerase sigma-70 factor (ECF subfamily)
VAKKRPSNRSGHFQELVHRAVQGDSQVFGELLNPFRNLLRDYGRQYFPKELKGKMDVSDLIQQTLWKAWQSFDTFHGKSKRALAGWLQVIMRHIIDNHLREYHRRKRDVGREVPLNAQQGIMIEDREPFSSEQETEEETLRFRMVFSRLPELYQEILYLRKYQGLTYKEIAARVGGTAEGARKLYLRAAKRFMEEWEKSH